jgi:hypothetical protein
MLNANRMDDIGLGFPICCTLNEINPGNSMKFANNKISLFYRAILIITFILLSYIYEIFFVFSMAVLTITSMCYIIFRIQSPDRNFKKWKSETNSYLYSIVLFFAIWDFFEEIKQYKKTEHDK